MPKYFLHRICLVLLVANFSFAQSCLAGQDPLDATSSATATVPTLSDTSDHTAPSTPILIRPEDKTVTGNNQPEFVWKNSFDTGSNTIIYALYLNDVATYLGISNLGNSSGNGFTARLDGEETKLDVTIPLSDGTYTWYITATDPSGNTSTSTTWSFTIDTVTPFLTVIDIDSYHNPVIEEGSNFDIDGPKDVNFTIHSDPYATIQITIDGEDGSVYNLQSSSSSSGLSYPYQHLVPGVYTVTILAIDLAGNITVLPTFTITIHQASVTIIVPGIIEPIINVPYTPIAVLPPSLPATISFIVSRGLLPYLIIIALAIILWYLLIVIWSHRYNLILLNDQGLPIKNTIVYHSIPDSKTKYTKVYLTKRAPLSYKLAPSDHGHVYIPHLNRYSTLTIRIDDVETCTIYIMSLSVSRKLYTITLG